MKFSVWRMVGIGVLAGAGMLGGGCVGGVTVGGKGVKFTVKEDVVYSPSGWPEELVADFYRPEVEGKVPVVLLVHGGSWAENDNRYQMRGIARRLAGEGFAVLNVTYRLVPKWHYPAPVDDVYEALRWLGKRADELGVDAERVGMYGYSAGGQLVEMAAMRDAPAGVKVGAVVAGATPHFLRLKPDFPVVEAYLGKTFEEDSAVYYAATPVDAVEADFPPVFIYHGTKDKLVPPVHTEKFVKRLEELGVEHEVRWVKGKGHVGLFLFPDGAVGEAVGFLKRKLVN